MIVNLTPRVVRVYTTDRADGIDDIGRGLLRTIDPEPQAAQLDPLDLVTTYQDDVPVELIEYGHASHVPTPLDGVFYIVPLEVALSLSPRRDDLLVTHREVRTSDGTVIGCRSLARPV